MAMSPQAVIDDWWTLPPAVFNVLAKGEVVAELSVKVAPLIVDVGPGIVAVTGAIAPVVGAVAALGICVGGAVSVYQASPYSYHAAAERRLLADPNHDPMLCFKDEDTGIPCCNTAVKDLKCDQNGKCQMHEKDIPSCNHSKTDDTSSWFCVSWRADEGTAGRIFSDENAAREFFMQKSLNDESNSIFCNESGVSKASRSSRRPMDQNAWAQMEKWCRDHRDTPADNLCSVKTDTASCGCGWIDDGPSCERGPLPGSGCYEECRDANPDCFCPGSDGLRALARKPVNICPTKHDADGCSCWWIDECHGEGGACFEPCRRANPDCFCPGGT